MEWVTAEADIRCRHDGRVANVPAQRWVTVAGVPVLVENDPEGRRITGCPNVGPTIKPCATTLAVKQGYSTWVRVDGKPVVLVTLDGLTDGTPPGTVHYGVKQPGQSLVGADG